jgi:hypothetical protein
VQYAIIRRLVDRSGARVMDDHLTSSSALEPPRLAPPAADPAAAQRELERAKRAEAARITDLVQYLLHDKGATATD